MNFLSEILFEIKSIKTGRKDLVKFGLIIGIIFVVLSFLLKDYFTVLFSIGIALVLGGLVAPTLLRYPYLAWMSFAVIMGFFVFRIILAILFYLVILPIALIAKIFGRDVLDKNFQKQKESYWVPHVSSGTPNDLY